MASPKRARRLHPYEVAANSGNMVAEVIRRLGGPTATVVATGRPAQTWDRWRRTEMITDVATLFLAAKLTGIDPKRLAGPPKTKPKRGGLSSGRAARAARRRRPSRRTPRPPNRATRQAPQVDTQDTVAPATGS